MADNYNNWIKFSGINSYYHKKTRQLVANLIPEDCSILEFSSKAGELLDYLPNKKKIGVEFDKEFISNKKSKVKVIHFDNLSKKLKGKKFDYIVLSNTLSETQNIQDFLKVIRNYCHESTRVIVLYFNYFWKPFLDFGEILGLKSPQKKELNWLSSTDIDNFFYLENFDFIKKSSYFLFPYQFPLLSNFLNRFVSRLPLFQNLSLINYSIFKIKASFKNYSVSIVIPARNESGNMKNVLRKIPKLSKKQEIIFVEGNSTDDTYKTILHEVKKYRGPFKVKLFKQRGRGKGDAVRLGFSKTKNELLFILDADLTVSPKELPKFYKAISEGKAEMVMGSRLIYPMENEAMRTLNILGNKFFSSLFTFILDQRIKDTLCGTKVLLKIDYDEIVRNRKVFGDFDPFGDFDLIFGAAKLNLKILEIPIRYRERTYGTTNISRFSHGWLLVKMSVFALRRLKFV